MRYVTEDSRSDNVSERTYVTATASCPGDSRVISGGFDVHYLDTPWDVVESHPLAGGGGWQVRAFLVPQPLGGKIRPFTAYAVCAPERLVPPEGIDYPSRTVQANKGSKELTPDCEASSKAIGGGFDMSNKYRKLIRTQPNPGNGFRSWIVKVGTAGEGGDIKAYSVCVREGLLKDKAPKLLERAQTDRSVVNVGTERCPQGTYLLGGGAGTSDNDSTYTRWSHIRPGGGSQADPPKDWATGAKATLVRITLHAHALCGRLGSESLGGGGDKLSGKNPGWGDGMGGGRFK